MQLMPCDMRHGAGDMPRLYLRGYYSAFFFKDVYVFLRLCFVGSFLKKKANKYACLVHLFNFF